MQRKRTWSGHIVFKKGFKWKDLEEVFPELLRLFMEGSRQYEDEMYRIYLDLNMRDIKADRKPEGYLRGSKMKMVFPLTKTPQMYFHRGVHSAEIVKITEKVSNFLARRGINHEVKWNELRILALKR